MHLSISSSLLQVLSYLLRLLPKGSRKIWLIERELAGYKETQKVPSFQPGGL